MLSILMTILAAASAGAPVTAAGDTVVIPPRPWVEVLRAPPPPVSLFCTPAGAGADFAAADGFGTGAVDANLEIVLWSDQPGWGSPVPFFPRQDI